MKLSPASEAIVKATAGVVAENAETITRTFYPDMFAAHPELMRVFNKANQAIGEQPKALAASVVAYAVNLIDPDAPDFTPVMQRIAHKHVSLGIKAQEYTIVGHHLMKAVGAVLGDAVTPEVAAAWDEVYWLFGCALIAEEAKLYALGGTDPDNPWRKYRVVERFEESDDIFSLVLAPVEGETPRHSTGQYVAIAVDLPDGSRQPRQYTISSGPRGDALRVTIKRVYGVDGAPDGQVSNWWATTPSRERSWSCRSPLVTWCWRTATIRSCWSRQASALLRWPRSSRTCRAVSPIAPCGCSTPTTVTTRIPSTRRCGVRCCPWPTPELRTGTKKAPIRRPRCTPRARG